MYRWMRNAGGVLMISLATVFAVVEGWDISTTLNNKTNNRLQEQSIQINEDASDENRLEIAQIKVQLENMSQIDDLNVRSPGCRCIKRENEGKQVWLMCPTKGPVCDSRNRTRCENENPGFEC
ncbi:hypothetical protein NLU14_07960 [Marinobacter sp. 71-i]|uniref:Secreted protein n=1 Tax=Marinobacter iranensis TaxID=2962607 RepID=A0ABT5Y908_9GAMM|nr:hypothetical protein [Marinobacter iranensis]MDF0750165.1 hypothetical protein [Marinobacter iranensis]